MMPASSQYDATHLTSIVLMRFFGLRVIFWSSLFKEIPEDICVHSNTYYGLSEPQLPAVKWLSACSIYCELVHKKDTSGWHTAEQIESSNNLSPSVRDGTGPRVTGSAILTGSGRVPGQCFLCADPVL